MLCLSQYGCLAVAIIEGATDVVAAVATAPIKVGSAVVDAATGDEDDNKEKRMTDSIPSAILICY